MNATAGVPRVDRLDLVEAMKDPSIYPHEVKAVEVRETHLSWVFLAGPYVYKVKKPLLLAFVDQRDAGHRHWLCCEEVRLNNRLAFGTYLGVRGLALRDGRWHLTEETAPDAADFAVEMRRFDETQTLAGLLRRGAVGEAELADLGALVAAFHERAERVSDPRATGWLARSVSANLDELASFAGSAVSGRELAAAKRFAAAFFAASREQLLARARAGRVREGHGDLRMEHVLLRGHETEIVDCVEFDAALRQIDVGADIAFLAMDLEAAGRRDLAKALIRGYRGGGGDPGDDRLLDFFVAYRAWVRCKVACMRAAQLAPDAAEAGAAHSRARTLAGLARRAAWRARGAQTLVVCGPAATGKTSLSTELAARSGLDHINSDVVRKREWGVDPTAAAPEQAYAPEVNATVYAELGRRAAELLPAGGSIIDATFRHEADRAAFLDAYGRADTVVAIECRAPSATTRRRAAARSQRHGSVSDAGTGQAARQQAEFAPLDELAAARHLTLRTDRAVADVADDVEALLDARLAAGWPTA